MASCSQVRPLLFRCAEGESLPEEALRVARHLPGCTACKILLARERRLAQMLEEDLPDLAVGEDFVQSVMSTLPSEPPRRAKSTRWRGLKLAGLVGSLGLLPLLGARGLSVGNPLLEVGLPTLNMESAEGTMRGGFELFRLALLALDAVAANLVILPSTPGAGVVASGLVVSGLAALATGSTLLAVAAAGWVRRR